VEIFTEYCIEPSGADEVTLSQEELQSTELAQNMALYTEFQRFSFNSMTTRPNSKIKNASSLCLNEHKLTKPKYSIDRTLGGLHSQSGHCGEKGKFP
jgi:hypothetical protein